MKPRLYLQPIYNPNVTADYSVWVCMNDQGWTVGETPLDAWTRFQWAKEQHEQAVRTDHEERCLEVGAWI